MFFSVRCNKFRFWRPLLLYMMTVYPETGLPDFPVFWRSFSFKQVSNLSYCLSDHQTSLYLFSFARSQCQFSSEWFRTNARSKPFETLRICFVWGTVNHVILMLKSIQARKPVVIHEILNMLNLNSLLKTLVGFRKAWWMAKTYLTDQCELSLTLYTY